MNQSKAFVNGKWSYLYFILATLVVSAICVALAVSHFNINQYEKAISETTGSLSAIENLAVVASAARKLNSVGNDVFEKNDIKNARRNFDMALRDYRAALVKIASFEREHPQQRAHLSLEDRAREKDLRGAIQEFTEQAIKLELEVLDFVERGLEKEAASKMAAMDRKFSEAFEADEKCRLFHRNVILSAAEKHRENLKWSRTFEFYFFLLILLPVLGLTYFGNRLNKYIRKSFAEAQRNTDIIAALSRSAIVAYTDKRGKITDVNDLFCEISGFEREELIGKDHRILNSGEHPKEYFQQMWTAISAGKTWSGDIQNRKKNGELYIVRTFISSLKDPNGEISEYLAIRFDVTEQKKTNATLIEAQRAAQIGSWKYDFATGDQYWSSEHYRIFEIEEPQTSDALFKLYRERIHKDDLPELNRVMYRAITFGEDFSYNHRVSLDGGTRIKHVRGIGRVTKDRNGKPLYISGTCQDLTDHVALQDQNKFVLKSVGIGIWEFNFQNSQIKWDSSMYELYGLKPSDFASDTDAANAVIDKSTSERLAFEIEKAIRENREFSTTITYKDANGELRHIGTKGAIIRDQTNQPLLINGISWDRTNEIESQMESQETKRLLQSIIDASPALIFVKNLSNEIMICNSALASMYRSTPHQLEGKDLADLLPTEQIEAMSINDAKIIATGKPLVFEHQSVVNGELRWSLISHYPLHGSDGEIIAMCATITDIQESKENQVRLQKELELERAKSIQSAKLASLGEMAAGIAHEINNPLSVIMGSTRLLTKFHNDKDRLEAKILAIKKSSERIQKIVSGLKKFSRSGGVSEFKIEKLSVIISEVLVLTESKSKRHGTPISVELAADLAIKCDLVEIEQVLVNLVNNGIDAVKRSNNRWIKIVAFESDARVHIQVIDSGNGIEAEIEKKLFQPFFTTKSVGEGTGLGLSIAKGILDNHSAEFFVNRDMKNTCFEIRFSKVMTEGGSRAA